MLSRATARRSSRGPAGRQITHLGSHQAQGDVTLVDRHDYHQALTELARVAGGTRAAGAVRIPPQEMLASRARFCFSPK